ncbi:hypothetical protein H4V97_002158 [Flavobacterium sp. CG_23.5]|uniref:hypothetical protein n=1 Tax=unclassified Flavobacterium TaxID=196869 RepID=UPI0018CB705D|nr:MULTISPECIES: hypothetical protein [unclassified Flavobacterium]MBG6110818.1 hypothetical protein [Flavobacterium sp. CG_9.10]MBP2283840.1 hypothetical protein [Flavobacterium sp. CG_23.5]
MKKLIFTLAFAMIGSFAFANNGTINEKLVSSLQNEKSLDSKTSTKIDYITFTEMVNRGKLKIVSLVRLDKSFLFIDDCGNEWIVSYDSTYYTPYTAFRAASELIFEISGC